MFCDLIILIFLLFQMSCQYPQPTFLSYFLPNGRKSGYFPSLFTSFTSPSLPYSLIFPLTQEDFFHFSSHFQVQSLLSVLETLLQDHNPTIHHHFRSLGLKLDVFSVNWFLTLFSSSFPLDLTSRIWDNFFMECDAR